MRGLSRGLFTGLLSPVLLSPVLLSAVLLSPVLLVAGCGGLSSEVADGNQETRPGSATSAAAAATTTASGTAASATAPPTTAPPTTAATTTAAAKTGTGEEAPENSTSGEVSAGPLPTTATDLAADLTTTERAIRDPSLDASTIRGWGQRLQRLYRVLSANAGWGDDVVASVADDVRPDVALNWIARQNLSALVGSSNPSTTLPAWHIQQPKPVNELRSHYQKAEDETGVPWEVLAAINFVETRMGRIVGLSTAGAVGPMQFLPSTWAECCQGDPADDRDAIIGAAVYLTHRGAPDDIDRALFGYNNSQHYVNAVTSYAAVMERDSAAYDGYHAFEVYFRSSEGLIRIPVGYHQTSPVDVADWLKNNPDSLIG